MKKILCIGLAVFFVIALSACINKQGAASSPAVSPDNTLSAAGTGTEPPVVSDGEQASSGSIIAESSNTVSDKEIEAILDDLSGELDSALDDAENLEELDDSDLDLDNIE